MEAEVDVFWSMVANRSFHGTVLPRDRDYYPATGIPSSIIELLREEWDDRFHGAALTDAEIDCMWLCTEVPTYYHLDVQVIHRP